MERSWDDYLIPGTDVLRNKITADGEYPYGLDSQRALSIVERLHAEQRATELEAAPILGQFDYDHMKALHYHLFQDVYDWAGQERTAPIPGPLVKYGPDVSKFPDVDMSDRFVAARFYYQDFRDAGPLAEVLAQAVRPLTDAERDAHPIVPVEARRARHVASAAFGGGVVVQPSSVQHHAAPPAPTYEPYQHPGYSL